MIYMDKHLTPCGLPIVPDNLVQSMIQRVNRNGIETITEDDRGWRNNRNILTLYDSHGEFCRLAGYGAVGVYRLMSQTAKLYAVSLPDITKQINEGEKSVIGLKELETSLERAKFSFREIIQELNEHNPFLKRFIQGDWLKRSIVDKAMFAMGGDELHTYLWRQQITDELDKEISL